MYTEALKYYSAPNYYTAAAPSYYVGPKYYTELQFTTLQPTLPSATIPRPLSHTDAPKYYTTKAPETN
jgi:hypothetical protein